MSVAIVELRNDATVQGLRNTHAADLVTGIFERGSPSGWAYKMARADQSFAPNAYSVSTRNFAVSFLHSSHNIAHNLGALHAPDENNPSTSLFPWSFAHRITGTLNTVVANRDLPNLRLHFSNPDVSIAGVATGIEDERDNARTLRVSLPVAARFRQGGGGSPPEAPSDLEARALNGTTVELLWTDNADDETGFEVERRRGTAGFRRIATLPANSSRHVDSGLASGVLYTYRVRARNGAGPSPYSAEVGARTSGEPAPTNLRLVVLDAGSVEARWSSSSSNIDGFEIEIQDFGDWRTVAEVASSSAGEKTAVIEGLWSQVRYRVRVRGLAADGPTAYSNVVSAETPRAAPAPCIAEPGRHCLNDERFGVEVRWRNFEGQLGSGSVVDTPPDVGAADSGLFWFFGAVNWELLVKVLDACSFNDRVWVSAAATTDVEYVLRVQDSATGEAVTYYNPLGEASQAVLDVDALDVCASNTGESEPWASLEDPGPFDWPDFEKTACGDDTQHLCLLGERFRAEVEWRDFMGNTGRGEAVSLTTDNSGLFWFFGPRNWEMMVKVLDGCGLNERYWVFAAATTDVEYVLRVTDRQTGEVQEYLNPLGRRSAAVTDTSAFDGCP